MSLSSGEYCRCIDELTKSKEGSQSCVAAGHWSNWGVEETGVDGADRAHTSGPSHATSHNIVQQLLSHLFTSDLSEQGDLVKAKPKARPFGVITL